ncbi:MAG: hypothetical protein Kow0068_03310 [Marinilabiliales bacterium]
MHIGNDIIDLTDSENIRSFSSLKYINKILNDTELYQIDKINIKYLPELFWTCKECAYKIMLKKGLNKAFSPKKFLVELINKDPFVLKVHYFNNTMSCKSLIYNNKYIHTWGGDSSSFYGIKTLIKETQQQIIKHISEKININEKRIIINKKNGIPFLVIKPENTTKEISFSHDGKYYASAWLE